MLRRATAARRGTTLTVEVQQSVVDAVAGEPFAVPIKLANGGDTPITNVKVAPALRRDLKNVGDAIEVDALGPGDEVIAHLQISTRRRLTYTVATHPVHLNVTYTVGDRTFQSVVDTTLEPRATYHSIFNWTIVGALIGLAAPHFPDFAPFFEWTDAIAAAPPDEFFGPFPWGPVVVQPIVESVFRIVFTIAIAGVLTFLLYSGDRRASRVGLTVLDLRGGVLVGFLAGLNGPQVLDTLRSVAGPAAS